jgi:hypothetical protein
MITSKTNVTTVTTMNVITKYALRTAPSLHQLIFDLGVHRFREGALNSHDCIMLDQNVLLDKPEAALPGVDWCDVQILVDCPLGQGDTAGIALGDQPAQYFHASS